MMMRTRGIKMKAKKEKKKITLREYHKKRMVTGIAILVTEIFENTAEHYKLDNTPLSAGSDRNIHRDLFPDQCDIPDNR